MESIMKATVAPDSMLVSRLAIDEIPQPREEFDDLVTFYREREYAPGDAQWEALVDGYRRKILDAYEEERRSSATPLRRVLGWIKGKRDVKKTWQQQWQPNPRLNAEYFAPAGSAGPFEWGTRCLSLRNAANVISRTLLLANTIAYYRPRSVFEVGFGDGLNLLLLASMFPNVEFGGVELTRSGMETAKRFRENAALPDYIVDVFRHRKLDRIAFRRVDFQQGSAKQLSRYRNSADMVITCVALEQMEAFRNRAIRQTAGVARKWVAFVEPFRDFNATGMRRLYIQTYNYFAATIDDLYRFSLQPVFVSDDVPQKLNLHAGLVVCRK